MKKLSRAILFFSFILFSISSHACWSLKERSNIEGFAELDDELILSFKDAVSCQPLADAKVMLGTLQYTSDAQGYIRLPMQPFAAQMEARLALNVSKPGYITLATDLLIEAGTVLNRRLVLSPVLAPGKTRFVLQWADEPEDLDLHLTGPGFHISYRDMRNARNQAKLDTDEIEGYGPETITLDRIDSRQSYALWVYNYSNDANYKGVELVYVYSGDQLLKEIRLPATKKRSVKVLQINNAQFQFINTPSSDQP